MLEYLGAPDPAPFGGTVFDNRGPYNNTNLPATQQGGNEEQVLSDLFEIVSRSNHRRTSPYRPYQQQQLVLDPQLMQSYQPYQAPPPYQAAGWQPSAPVATVAPVAPVAPVHPGHFNLPQTQFVPTTLFNAEGMGYSYTFTPRQTFPAPVLINNYGNTNIDARTAVPQPLYDPSYMNSNSQPSSGPPVQPMMAHPIGSSYPPTRRLSTSSSTLTSIEGGTFLPNQSFPQNNPMVNHVPYNPTGKPQFQHRPSTSTASGTLFTSYSTDPPLSGHFGDPTTPSFPNAASNIPDAQPSMPLRNNNNKKAQPRSKPYTAGKRGPKRSGLPGFCDIRPKESVKCRWVHHDGTVCRHDFGKDNRKAASAHALVHRAEVREYEKLNGRTPAKVKIVCRWPSCDSKEGGVSGDVFARHFIHHTCIQILCEECGQILARADSEGRHRETCCADNQKNKPHMIDEALSTYERIT
ncbi:hypothetical protein EV360DRAFT_87063 [Lentinula raphanica]|nr:hypothetical protein EV360DRAFT_87063 [Lentinula raphanica]